MYQSIGKANGCDAVCSVQPAAAGLQKGICLSHFLPKCIVLLPLFPSA